MTSVAAIDSLRLATLLRPHPPGGSDAFSGMNYMWMLGPGITLLVVGILAAVFIPLMRQSAQRRQLLATGVRARGRILSTQETGLRVNNQPQVKFTLEVQPDGKPAYQAECKMVISLLYAPQIQHGMTVSVRYDAQDPTKVAIEL
jgi:type II secretory pathway pseudopilin PulG